jgi:predicted DNA-binding protein YlxM (UPF0122 family)
MARPLNPDQRAELEREAWALRVQGWTLRRIADQLGVCHQAVHAACSRVEKRLHAQFSKRTEQVKSRQTAQLEHLIHDVLDEWRRSKLDAETVKTTDGGGEPKTERTVKGQTGNPALLAQARGAMEDIRKIWGVDAPIKTEISGPNGGAVAVDLFDAALKQAYGSRNTEHEGT